MSLCAGEALCYKASAALVLLFYLIHEEVFQKNAPESGFFHLCRHFVLLCILFLYIYEAKSESETTICLLQVGAGELIHSQPQRLSQRMEILS